MNLSLCLVLATAVAVRAKITSSVPLRLKDLEGAPKVKLGRSDEMLERINRFRDKLDVWEGELYLEKHQGTLTTQAKVKKMNRKLEYLLKHIEFVYSCLPYEDYPADDLDHMWKLLLINQFHDIIPGSSITRVYNETHAQYDEVMATGLKLLDAASAKLMETADSALTLFNPLGCEYAGPMELPEGWNGAELDGEKLDVQMEKRCRGC